MPDRENSLAGRSGHLLEAHRGYDPRVVLFYFVVTLLLLVLAGGLAWQQLFKADVYHERERVQNHRRILVPGPRGNIYDRAGRLLVGNVPRFSVVLYLDELQSEFIRESRITRRNFRDSGDRDLPSRDQIGQIARVTVVQRYLDQVNGILRRDSRVERTDLRKHFERQLLLPYTLLDDLAPDDYARLVERLPVRSPLQVFASSTRQYPYGSAAAHTLGYVAANPDIDVEDFPGGDLKTFKMKGTLGVAGLEKQFDDQLQGDAGGSIYRVDPAGFKINPPLDRRLPVQGRNLVSSLDIELQQAAEQSLVDREQNGAAVALDVRTGEVLVLAAKPDYNLADFAPRLTAATVADINARGAWLPRALNGLYPPGSTFKLVTSAAAFRAGVLTPASTYETNGFFRVGRTGVFRDHHGCVTGLIDFGTAIEQSVNTYFINYGLLAGPAALAAEFHRFHLDERTGIELPGETARMFIGTDAWKRKRFNDPWAPGDTANLAFGQGFIDVTPLQMACFIASFARGETHTRPTLLHDAHRPAQHSEPIGLNPLDSAALLAAMERVVTHGTGSRYLRLTWPDSKNYRIAAKTGTAQREVYKEGKKTGNLEIAWYVCYAPVENPEIAVAVVVEGDTPDESYAGGQYAAPVVGAILKAYFEKKSRPPGTLIVR